MDDERIELRKKDFKKAIDRDEARRKRDEHALRLRKEKRDANLSKKRHMGNAAARPTGGRPVDQTVQARLNKIPQWLAMIKEQDSARQLEATTQFRKLLSIERNPPIQEVIRCGVVPRLVEFLTHPDNSKLVFEAAWALTNIASGSSEQTRVVIEAGAAPIFVQLLASPDEDVREQCVWALGNIAGDSPQCRDYVLQHGAMGPLLQNLQQSSKLSMLRNGTWTLSNYCRGKPQPPFDLVSPALRTLARLIYSTDEEVLTDSCWALSYLSDGSNDKIQAVIEAGVARRLVELLMHTSFSVQTPALRTIGNIVTGDDLQTQIVLNVSALPCLLTLLTSARKGIRKEACWTISNITAGNKQQIQGVIDANIIPVIIRLLGQAEWDIKKEAAWAISNATSGGSPDQLRYMITQNCLQPLCDLIGCADARIIVVALEALENLLKVGAVDEQKYGVNKVANFIEEYGGLDKIEALQNHENHEVYDKSVRIIELHFAGEEDDGLLDGLAPQGFGGPPGGGFAPAPGGQQGGFHF